MTRQEKEQKYPRKMKAMAERPNQIIGFRLLKQALSEVRANCSDSQLRADHQKKIAKQKDEVAERQQKIKPVKKAMPIRLPNANGNWQSRSAGRAEKAGSARLLTHNSHYLLT